MSIHYYIHVHVLPKIYSHSSLPFVQSVTALFHVQSSSSVVLYGSWDTVYIHFILSIEVVSLPCSSRRDLSQNGIGRLGSASNIKDVNFNISTPLRWQIIARNNLLTICTGHVQILVVKELCTNLIKNEAWKAVISFT